MTTVLGIASSRADAGPAGLCRSDTSRGTVPDAFAIDACFDGTDIALHNNLTVALTIGANGDVGRPIRHEADYGLAADATRLKSNDPFLLLPGDHLSIPVGSGAAAIRVYTSPDAGFYALATTVQTFVPGSGPGVVNAFTGLIAELDADFGNYENCLQGKDWIGQLGCRAGFVGNVIFAFGRAAVSGLAHAALAVILAGYTFARWLNAQPKNEGAVVHSPAFAISAAQTLPAQTLPAQTLPAQTLPPQTLPTTPPPVAPLSIGSSFDSECVVAWPTAPTYTSEGVQLTMSCSQVPEAQYLFTDVIYNDPSFQITPDTGQVEVQGRVVDIATSDYGFKELVVQADKVTEP